MAASSPESSRNRHTARAGTARSPRRQIPAFVIFDQYLADSVWTYEALDLSKITYTDYRLRGEAFKKIANYKRHALTDNGVSPLGVPGDSAIVVVTDSDEHDEAGHITEDLSFRKKIVEKRLRKGEGLLTEIIPPEYQGDKKPDLLLACWGSTRGSVSEAVKAN